MGLENKREKRREEKSSLKRRTGHHSTWLTNSRILCQLQQRNEKANKREPFKINKINIVSIGKYEKYEKKRESFRIIHSFLFRF